VRHTTVGAGNRPEPNVVERAFESRFDVCGFRFVASGGEVGGGETERVGKPIYREREPRGGVVEVDVLFRENAPAAEVVYATVRLGVVVPREDHGGVVVLLRKAGEMLQSDLDLAYLDLWLPKVA